MPTDREKEIIEAYQAWNPGDETISELAERLDISRSRLYAVLKDHDIELKTGRRSKKGSDIPADPLLAEMAENALSFLMNQLYQCRDELRRYRERYGPL